MSDRPIIDAGPGLNFLSIHKERLLIGVLGQLSAPEAVQREVLRKANQDGRFLAAAMVWRKLTPRWIEILSDEETPELNAVILRISEESMEERRKRSKDLGETMVIAHAVAAAEAGKAVTVLIDDGPGNQIAETEINRLARLKGDGHAVGSIELITTLTVLERAAGGEHLPNKGSMREIYKRLRCLDDGLPPIERTNLLSGGCWP